MRLCVGSRLLVETRRVLPILSAGALGPLVAVVTAPLLARVLGPESRGQAAYLVATTLVLSRVSLLGLSLQTAGARSLEPAERLVVFAKSNTVALVAVMLAVPIWLALIVGADVVELDGLQILLVIVLLPVLNVTQLWQSHWIALGRQNLYPRALVAESVLRLSGLLVVVTALVVAPSPYAVLLVMLLAPIAACVVAPWTASGCRIVSMSWVDRRFFRRSLTMASLPLSQLIGGRFFVLFIGLLQGPKAAGFAVVAFAVVEPGLLIPALIEPVVVARSTEGSHAARHLLAAMALLVGVLTVLLVLLGRVFLTIVFGAEYSPARALLVPLGIAVVAQAIYSLAASSVITHSVRLIAALTPLVIASSIGLTLSGAAAAGLEGAAWGYTASMVASAAMTVMLVARAT